jgi:hypothetical protein
MPQHTRIVPLKAAARNAVNKAKAQAKKGERR